MTALDVTIAHPANRSLDPEQIKISTYRGPCNDLGWDFEPLAFNTFGGMGPMSRNALGETRMSEAQQKTGCAGAQVLSEALQPKQYKQHGSHEHACVPVPIF